ncbi:MAG: hypothetical protein HFF09_04335 [Oscillospiraceae bacterium]|nr:hypothetical protein [Oscillospiraceae bacterium]
MRFCVIHESAGYAVRDDDASPQPQQEAEGLFELMIEEQLQRGGKTKLKAGCIFLHAAQFLFTAEIFKVEKCFAVQERVKQSLLFVGTASAFLIKSAGE